MCAHKDLQKVEHKMSLLSEIVTIFWYNCRACKKQIGKGIE